MDLYQLFERCINAEYKQVERASNYSLRRHGNTLYIFFEGSRGDDDWDVNLRFPAKSYKRMGKVIWFAHRGFLDAWKQTEPFLADIIMDKSIKKMIITGYSHGAAIALLCHEYVWFNRPDLQGTLEGYGFGCPRVLWGVRSRSLNARWESFYVIRNIDDAVTHLPPSALGYHHAGSIIEIGKRGKYSSIDAHRQNNILSELNDLKDVIAPIVYFVSAAQKGTTT